MSRWQQKIARIVRGETAVEVEVAPPEDGAAPSHHPVTTRVRFGTSARAERLARRAAERLAWIFSRRWGRRLLELWTEHELVGGVQVSGPSIPEEDYEELGLHRPPEHGPAALGAPAARGPGSLLDASAADSSPVVYNASLFDGIDLASNALLNYTELLDILTQPPFELTRAQAEAIIRGEEQVIEEVATVVGLFDTYGWIFAVVAAVVATLLVGLICLFMCARSRKMAPVLTAKPVAAQIQMVQAEIP